jgi:hypothetical protein
MNRAVAAVADMARRGDATIAGRAVNAAAAAVVAVVAVVAYTLVLAVAARIKVTAKNASAR